MIEQQIHIQEIESSQEIEEDEPDETLETLERRTPTENFRLEFLFIGRRILNVNYSKNDGE